MNMPQRWVTGIMSYSGKWSRTPTDVESWPYRKTPRHRSWGAIKRNVVDRLTWHCIPTTGRKIRNMQLQWPKLKHVTWRLCCHWPSLHVCHQKTRPLPWWCPSHQCHQYQSASATWRRCCQGPRHPVKVLGLSGHPACHPVPQRQWTLWIALMWLIFLHSTGSITFLMRPLTRYRARSLTMIVGLSQKWS